jgi:hypothetical protein
MDRTIVAEEWAELILTTRQLSIRLHSWEEDFFDVAGKELPGGVSRSSNLENKIDAVSDPVSKSWVASAFQAINIGQYASPAALTQHINVWCLMF